MRRECQHVKKCHVQDESDGGMTEIRFVPDDKNQLDTMFNVMSDCQV